MPDNPYIMMLKDENLKLLRRVVELSEQRDDLLATCENTANVVENVLSNLESDLWRIPEPTRATAVNFLRAVVEECRGVAAKARGE